jgi:cytochrome c
LKFFLHTTLAFAVTFAAGAASSSELGDASNGKKVFKKCSACHAVGEGAKNKAGAQLNGVFGRIAGTEVGAKYSKSMLRAGDDGLVWTQKTLNAFIKNPKALVSKTRMSFRGIKDGDDRADLLAFLRSYSDDPSNIPEAEPTAIGTDHNLAPSILALQGDPEYGEYLASECKTCHQTSGVNDGIPGVVGWPTEDFVIAMHAYKQKLRPHPVMQMMAGRLSDEEIAALAAYFKDLE